MATGLFLGVIFVMTQQMLIIFAIFVERSQVNASTQTLAVTQSQQAMAVFSWFLFMIYAGFGMMLYVFRNDLVTEGTVRAGLLFIFLCSLVGVAAEIQTDMSASDVSTSQDSFRAQAEYK
jgi:hypothetical protein